MSGLFGTDTPDSPVFVPVNQASTTALATQADKDAYARSDADFEARFPELVKARKATIADAIKQLGGNIGDKATEALRSAGLGVEAGAMSTGNTFSTSKNMGKGVLEKRERDRNYFETELSANGQLRPIGPSGGNILQIALANSGNLSAANNANYLTGVNAYNSSVAQGAQNLSGYASLLGGAFKQYYASQNQPTVINPYTSATDNIYQRNDGGGFRG